MSTDAGDPEQWIDDKVNPAHYKRGPVIDALGYPYQVEAIEVIRWIHDARLANAMKYLWRVAFGGKEDDVADLNKAVWYIHDALDHPVDEKARRRVRTEQGRSPAQHTKKSKNKAREAKRPGKGSRTDWKREDDGN